MRKLLFIIAIFEFLITYCYSNQKSKCQSSTCSGKISPYIKHYEVLNYETNHLYNQQMRSKRSVELDDFRISFRFKAFQHEFHIVLKRHTDVFHDRLKIVNSFEEPLNSLNTSHIYDGYLVDEPEHSSVFGSISNHDGSFEGSIRSQLKGIFYIERMRQFSPLQHNSSIHSVIYRDEHIITNPYSHKEDYIGACGITPEVSKWMSSVQNSVVDVHENDHIFEPKKSFTTKHLLSPSANFFHNREKRSTNKRMKDEIRNTCSLSIQTDPLLWRHIRQGFTDHADPGKKQEVDEKTREEILSLIAQHVTAVNYIYRDTKFDGLYEHRNIKFEVQRIKIDDDSSCYGQRTEDNSFCIENIDVSNFLNLHSLRNHEIFCLAYVFTYRDFSGGTLGLAWVASASGASGGICEKFKTYTETIGGLYQSTKRSLNTGIITFVNYNTRVPPKVSQLTLAHEIGHNFGSPHDYPSECRPGGLSGNYIMFASATGGDRPNNSKFSTCSIGNISNVLDAIESNRKFNCFTASAGAFCGNKIVEAGEECDCGYDKKECLDRCCYPRIFESDDLRFNETALGCKRRKGTQCSPSQGPCCSHNCELIPAYPRVTCREESDCSGPSMCNGMSPECPQPKSKADKTRCNNGTQLCINGECSGSICLEWNLNECFLTATKENNDKRKLCELACQNGTDVSTCRSTSEFAHLVGLPPGGISLRPGSPCDNFQGYCDVFLKCRAVDAEGPLVRLKNLLLNKETLIYIIQWITVYWWAVLLMAICFIIIMGLFIKCCAVYTPSSNPKKPPARRITDTLSRPMNTLKRMRNYNSHQHNGSRSRSNISRGHRTRTDHRISSNNIKSSQVAYSRANQPTTYVRACNRNSTSNIEQWNNKV